MPSHSRMFSFLFFAVLCTSCLAGGTGWKKLRPLRRPVGSRSVKSFSSAGGNGTITAIRVWEDHNNHIVGIQVRNGGMWTELFGRIRGTAQELELFDGEKIVQVSGKRRDKIYQIMFVTSRGRSLIAGQPKELSFNFYPTHPDAGLKLLNGTIDNGGLWIISVAAHWGIITD